ncbi:MAG: class III extradiol ring-cleavage dioxygenase, partial [Acidovorax sp.]|nr:class III extradiol ring-cleavage dioxygenase [Acidovorax sp.]
MDQNLTLEQRMPVYFLSHGGGPWPYVQGPFRDMMRWLEASLNDIPSQLPRTPKAILIASAHWEESAFKVTSSSAPGMVYDFTGFPASTYSAQYTAPGSPELAIRITELLDS